MGRWIVLVTLLCGCAGGRDFTLQVDGGEEPAPGGGDAVPVNFPDLGAPAADGTGPACDPDEVSLLGRCYLLVERETGMSYTKARKQCAERGSHVVTVGTVAENAAVLSLLAKPASPVTHTSAGVWIGLRRAASGSHAFVWESGQPPTYVNWAPGEPSNHNGNEDCVVVWRPGLSHAGRWNDAPCDSPRRGAVICARSP